MNALFKRIQDIFWWQVNQIAQLFNFLADWTAYGCNFVYTWLAAELNWSSLFRAWVQSKGFVIWDSWFEPWWGSSRNWIDWATHWVTTVWSGALAALRNLVTLVAQPQAAAVGEILAFLYTMRDSLPTVRPYALTWADRVEKHVWGRLLPIQASFDVVRSSLNLLGAWTNHTVDASGLIRDAVWFWTVRTRPDVIAWTIINALVSSDTASRTAQTVAVFPPRPPIATLQRLVAGAYAVHPGVQAAVARLSAPPKST